MIEDLFRRYVEQRTSDSDDIATANEIAYQIFDALDGNAAEFNAIMQDALIAIAFTA